jgi:hypothetical protein
MNWPANPIVALDGENIDGENNSLVATGSDAYSWANTGSFPTPFARATVPTTPLVKKLAGSSVVSFDGRDDQLTCAGSAAALGFINHAAPPAAGPVFSIALIYRLMAVRSSAVRLFGTEGKGLAVYSTNYQAGVSIEGGYQFFLNNGIAQLTNFATKKLAAQIGEVSCLFIEGDGTQLRCTDNFYDWESQAYLAAGAAGDASHDYAIGCTGGNPGSVDDFTCSDWFKFLIWPRLTTPAEKDLMLANFIAAAAFL